MKRNSHIGVSLLSIGVLVLIWYGVTRFGLVSRVLVPSPVAVYAKIVSGFIGGRLLQQTSSTVVSMLVGWVLCSVVGIVLGAIIGNWPLARRAMAPVLELFRPMPPAAVIPVAIAIFGLTREMSLAVIVFGAVWPALLATVHGFASIQPRLREVGQALEMSPLQFIRTIALPNAAPDIIAGLRLSLVISLVLAVITDMITGQIGLGSLVVLASRTFDMAGLFAGLVLLSLIGFASNAALQAIERRVLAYRQ
jgi:ABC-type nitrate/sulfonate/bicarbonate transport system permease component